MKIFAQSGHGEGQKIVQALNNNYIDGVIYSPKDISPSKLEEKLDELTRDYSDKEFLFDPQYYVSLMGSNPLLNIGKLEEYSEYYFSFESRVRLERETNLRKIIEKAILFQKNLLVSSIISPNILISRSFDSIEGAISKNFIRLANEINVEIESQKKVYSTLAISAEALMNTNELQEFLNSITIYDNHPPYGFYILIATRSLAIAQSEIFNADVIAGWMLLNYTLALNGFKVINGYSDLLSPLLVAVGGEGISTGWNSNLRNFCLERFAPEKREGGSPPIIRYLSSAILNRIRFDELRALKNNFNQILNNLPTDSLFIEKESDRTDEIMQTWDALATISKEVSQGSAKKNLDILEKKIQDATELYSRITAFYQLDKKSLGYHLEPIYYGIKKFKRLAEIEIFS